MKKFKAVLIDGIDDLIVADLNEMFEQGYQYEGCITENVAAGISTTSSYTTKEVEIIGKSIAILSKSE